MLIIAAPSCQDEFVPDQDSAQDKYALRFVCDDVKTKSEVTEGLPQERVLNSIDVYFYRDGATSSDAVYHKRLNLQDCYTRYNANIDFLASEVSSLFLSSATCEVFAIANVDESLVPGNDSDALTGSSIPNLKALAVSSTFGSAAGTNHIPESFVMTGYNTITLTSRSKTTVATGTVPLFRLAAKLELLIHVKDSIHLATTYKDDLNVEYPAREVWYPMIDKEGNTAQVEAYLENGYKEAKLGVQSDPSTYMVTSATAEEGKFFSYSKNKMPYDSQTTLTITEPQRWTYSDFQNDLCSLEQVGLAREGMTVNTSYMYSEPAYTYPETWTRGVEKEPFYKLCLPWRREGILLVYKNGLQNPPEVIQNYNTAQKQYYYKIVFPVDALESNNFYRFKMNVAILGSETDDAKVVMTPTYSVAGWQNKSEILEEAEVGNARFLSVAQSAYTLYNEKGLSIPIVSSDDCIIVNAYWYKPYYGTKNAGSNDGAGNRISNGNATDYNGFSKITGGKTYGMIYNSTGTKQSGTDSWTFNIVDNKIVFEHALNNAQGTSMDVTPYYITFTIEHYDYQFPKTITIIQYPAIYISQVDGGNVFIDGYFGNVGGAYSNNYTSHNFNTWNATYTMTPYMTVTRDTPSGLTSLTRVSVSSFTSSSNSFTSHNGSVKYIISDPRVSSNWSSSDLIAYGTLNGEPSSGQNTVTPVSWGDKAAKILVGTTEPQIIAPSIFVGSYWASMSSDEDLSFENAKKRCATYQEAGYPAGRWRLPTEAEVNYVQQLQTNGHVATLFNVNYHYWTSSGYAYKASESNYKNSGTDPGVRCVYDVWYWGETPESSKVYHPSPTK